MSAKTSYEKARKDIQRLIEQIQIDLDEHDEHFAEPENQKNWAFVGNLDHVREMLQEVNERRRLELPMVADRL